MEPDYTIQSISLYNLSVCIYKCKPCDILRIPLHKNENIFYAHKTSHITFYREDTLHNQIDRHGSRVEFYHIFCCMFHGIDYDNSGYTYWDTNGHTRGPSCMERSIYAIRSTFIEEDHILLNCNEDRAFFSILCISSYLKIPDFSFLC